MVDDVTIFSNRKSTQHIAMARFVKNTAVSTEIESVFEDAEESLLIVSPFIKLHRRFKDILKPKQDNPDLEVTLLSRSLSSEDFSFFKQFANIKIYYEPTLHAKYYESEYKGVISSMNLYEFSQDHNIEVGVVIEGTGVLQKFREKIAGTRDHLDEEASGYFQDIIENRSPVYHKEPQFKEKMFGRKEYTGSNVIIDSLTDQLSSAKAPKATPVEKKKRVTPSKVVKSKLLTTKQLSQLTGLSSQKVNSWFTDNKLMYKKDKDWVITEKGKEIGGLEKSGQYGIFVAWPEVVAKRIVE